MPGKWIHPCQVELYMRARSQNFTQAVAAAKAGIAERSGRSIEQGKHCDPKGTCRARRRPDPLGAVWESELCPLLEQQPALAPITLLEQLQDRYPGAYPDTMLRTLQRRVKQWRHLSGPEKEVVFRQTHVPGRQGLSDFTQLKGLTICIAGRPFSHLLYHFRLAYSHWSAMKVIQGGESYAALSEGLQDALQQLGGCPTEHRTDSLSAAFKNRSAKEQEDMTVRYDALCRHYGMIPTRNNRGKGHENGSIESPHGNLKRRIKQALLLRGNYQFDSVTDYQHFITRVVTQSNKRNAKLLETERPTLLSLPITKIDNYQECRAVVSSSSTITVRRVTYTVPSRLQGAVLNVHIYHDRLMCYVSGQHVVNMTRVIPEGGKRGRQVNYRHLIHSLVKKPQAFRYSRLRDDLLPDAHYRSIWCAIDKSLPPQEACRMIVGLLYLAATQDCEKALGEVVLAKLNQGQSLSLKKLQAQFCRTQDKQYTAILVPQHTLAHYNQLIPTLYPQEVAHA